jgi:hypothetical protein
MQSIRRGVSACLLVVSVALSVPASAAEREPGQGAGRIIQVFKRFVAHILGDISIPPG